MRMRFARRRSATRRKTQVALAITGLFVGIAVAAVPPKTQRNFVSCPIVRDTATVPCWLAEYDGELYYLGIQTDISAEWYPPYLGHRVLVEGTIADEPRICGGIVLKPNRISVLPELDPSCNTILPAVDEYTVPFAPRGPGPSKGGLAFANSTPRQPPPAPTPPYQTKEYSILYEFDARSVTGRTGRVLQQVVRYAQLANASRISIEGSRGSVLLSDGTILNEQAEVAQVRAQQIAELLQAVGISAEKLKVSWHNRPAIANGVDDFERRRVTIVVRP
jgi:outer membrane protein OmpA-like peptidoglycan-associated protein